MEYSVRDFLEMFNDGELDVEKYFNDYETFFSVLKKKGLMGELDPKNGPNTENWQNEYLLWLYDNDKEKYYKWIKEFLGDIQVEGENKVYWLGERKDLAILFCDNRRNDLSRDTIESILDGENDWEPYWDTTDNVYRDVVDELDEKNLIIFKERIIKELTGKQISPETEEMQLIASEQGHDDYWEINEENVSRIIDDEDSLNSLLDDELGDIKADLYSIHNNSYNSAYEEEIYDRFWKELFEYFDDKGEWISTPHPYKKDVTVHKLKVPISDFEGVVNDYLSENKKYASGTLEYHGSFLEILRESFDCLSAWAPDYPNPSKIDKNINDYFSDYF